MILASPHTEKYRKWTANNKNHQQTHLFFLNAIQQKSIYFIIQNFNRQRSLLEDTKIRKQWITQQQQQKQQQGNKEKTMSAIFEFTPLFFQRLAQFFFEFVVLALILYL